MGSYFNFLVKKSGIKKPKEKKPTVITSKKKSYNLFNHLSGVVSGIVAFTVVIAILPRLVETMNVSANISIGVPDLIGLIPLILIGAVIMGVVVVVARLSV